jgi:O-antigen biosynthesis protein
MQARLRNGESSAGSPGRIAPAAPRRRPALIHSPSSHSVLTETMFQLRRWSARLHRTTRSALSRGVVPTVRKLFATPAPAPSGHHGRLPAPPAAAPAAGTVLVVDAMPPTPDRDSGSLRLCNIMGLLRERGYRVCFLADDGTAPDRTDADPAIAGVEVLQEAPVDWLRGEGARLRAAILCRHQVALPWIPLLRKYAPQARLIFDTVDVHHIREQREAAQRGSRLLGRHARATRRRECAAAGRADATWVVSEDERRHLAQLVPDARIRVVSNSVHPIRPGPGFDARRDLVFIGGHRHPPNTDAAWWLVEEVFPCIRALLPEVRLHLVGDEVPRQLRIAASRREGLEVHGHVPDLASYLDGCRVAVVPLRYGAGVKGKISMSMAHGQPVVSTRCGVEGMQLRDGEDVLVADTAHGLAHCVARLYGDRALWQRVSQGGLANARRHYSLETVSRALEQDFPTPVPSTGQPPAPSA